MDLVKRALYKGIGCASLFWNELEEVLLDVEVTLNNRPLCYVEDDVQLPVLAPSAMMFGQPKSIPEDLHEEDSDLRKRARYLHRCLRCSLEPLDWGVFEIFEGEAQPEAQN